MQPADLSFRLNVLYPQFGPYLKVFFEAIKNPSLGYLRMTQRSVFIRGIRKWPSSGVRRDFAQK